MQTKPTILPEPRPFMEIQEAHDILSQVLMSEALRQKVIPQMDPFMVMAGLNAICWVLNHMGHQGDFNTLIDTVKTRLRDLGIVFLQAEQPFQFADPDEETVQ